MIMAAPFPSGVSQNVQIFLPLTDLDYRMYSCDFRAEHKCMGHVLNINTHAHTPNTRQHWYTMGLLANEPVLQTFILDLGLSCPLR